MTSGQLNPVIRFIRQLATAHSDGDPDRLLLERFALRRDETAFAVLVQRHAPLVWGVCQRVLHHQQDSEDAFQATFLVLARKAGSIRKREALPSWLFGVAYRVAMKAQAEAARREIHERQVLPMPGADPLDEVIWRDLRPVLDEAIHALPARYRLPFILCHLQGRTNEQAAQQLGCPLGTVLSRLARARQLLRARLSRRGLALSAGVLTTVVARQAEAAVAGPLIESTIQAGIQFTVSKAAAAGVVSAHVIALAEGGMKTMFVTKLTLAALLLAVGMFGAGAGALSYRVGAVEAGAEQEKAPKAADGVEELTDLVRVASLRDGIITVVGTEIKAGEKVPADRIITVKIDGTEKQYRRLKRGDTVEAGQMLARLDDRIARDDVASKNAKVMAAKADLVASEKTRDEAEQRFMTLMKLRRPGGVRGALVAPDEEIRAAQLTWERYKYEVDSRRAAVGCAEPELRQAKTILDMHEIRSPTRGVIKSILKRPGEGVQALATVFVIQVRDGQQ